MKCEMAYEQMNLALDGMLTEEELHLFEEHLEQCASCKEEYELLQSIQESLKAEEAASLPEDFHETLMSRIFEEATENNVEEKKENVVIPMKQQKRTWISKLNFRQLNFVAATLLVLIVSVAGIRLINMNNNEEYSEKSTNLMMGSESTERAFAPEEAKDEESTTEEIEVEEQAEQAPMIASFEASENDLAKSSESQVSRESEAVSNEMITYDVVEEEEKIMTKEDAEDDAVFTTMEEPVFDEKNAMNEQQKNESSTIQKIIITLIGIISLLGISVIWFRRYK